DLQGLANVQLATLNWVDWFNKKRIHSALGYVSPFEFGDLPKFCVSI
ncbi:integrase core domain-containing protein, partial [Psychrobacter glacincola]